MTAIRLGRVYWKPVDGGGTMHVAIERFDASARPVTEITENNRK